MINACAAVSIPATIWKIWNYFSPALLSSSFTVKILALVHSTSRTSHFHTHSNSKNVVTKAPRYVFFVSDGRATTAHVAFWY